MYDIVKHPEHYNYSEYETKDVIRAWGLNFNLGSAVKYISRAGHKDDIIQDLQKAKQFIEFEIEALQAAPVAPLQKAREIIENCINTQCDDDNKLCRICLDTPLSFNYPDTLDEWNEKQWRKECEDVAKQLKKAGAEYAAGDK